MIEPGNRPSSSAVLVWIAFALTAGALDGYAGGAAAVLVAAVGLARLPAEWLGRVGVACLALAPVSVLVDGLPSDATVSPGFVTRSLTPHHLVFGGFSLLAAWIVIDVRRHLRTTGHLANATVRPDPPDHPRVQAPAPLARLSRTGQLALTGAVAVSGAVIAIAVVLR